LVDDLNRFASSPPPGALMELLHADEVEAALARAAAVARLAAFPNPDPDRRPYPWPKV
jgi:hypothetical protein